MKNKMGRLTIHEIEKTASELMYYKDKLANGIFGDKIGCFDKAMEALKELQKYKDLEEQGRLYTCKLGVGNKAYLLRPSRVIEEYIVSEVNISRDGESYFAHSYGRFAVFNEDDIGDTWFLTKEEVEAKLKALEGVKK